MGQHGVALVWPDLTHLCTMSLSATIGRPPCGIGQLSQQRKERSARGGMGTRADQSIGSSLRAAAGSAMSVLPGLLTFW